MTTRPRVCVVGLGYIGLPTAAVLAHRGWDVVGVDTNEAVVATVNRGDVHISEPDLDALVHSAVESGRFRAHAAPVPADVYVICVPTPFYPDSSPPAPNTEHVLAAARAIAPVLERGNLVVIESTCPVGTTERVLGELGSAASGLGVHLAYCPERVLPGRILAELVSNDRVVGGIDPAASEAAERFYASFVEGAILLTTSRTAEMVKLVENSFRDVNIAFANEVSMVCAMLGIDAWELIRLANRHPRVDILQPGPGVGGHCIAVDPWFIVAENPELARLIGTAREVNNAKTKWVVAQVLDAVGHLGIRRRPARVACLGLAYKANIDDLRESPALEVARALARSGIEVLACEPNITADREFRMVDAGTAIAQSDLAVLLVAHREFLGLDFGDTRVLDYCGALPSRTSLPGSD